MNFSFLPEMGYLIGHPVGFVVAAVADAPRQYAELKNGLI
jgi:hypothetical protein